MSEQVSECIEKQKIDHGELKKTGFWLNQVFMIVSTIVGVFLAAQSGLEQALKFDTLNKMEDNYYLRMSLYDELDDAVKELEAYAVILAKSPPKSVIQEQRPMLEKYVWQTMKYNPTTLETPSEILSEVRRFYSKADRTIDQVGRWAISSRHASKLLLEQTEYFKNGPLLNLKNSAEELKRLLAKEDIQIGVLKGE